MDYTIATWRVKQEIKFACAYGDASLPRNAEVWSMIDLGRGTTEQHAMCLKGNHDYEWCPDIAEHVCFFCLHIQPLESDEKETSEKNPTPNSGVGKGKKRKRESAFGGGSCEDGKTAGDVGESSKQVVTGSSKDKAEQAEDGDQEDEEDDGNSDEDEEEWTEEEDEEAEDGIDDEDGGSDGGAAGCCERPDLDSDGKSLSETDSA